MKALITALAFAATAGALSPASADVYPARPITIVVPFAAGGPTDVIARVMAQHMRASLGQTVIVENVAAPTATSVSDGLRARHLTAIRISIGHWSTHVVNGAVYPLPYDLLKDFEPISLIATNSY